VLSYVRTFRLPALITRCSNNYGPNQFPEKLIPFFIAQLSQDEPVPVYGDGLNARNWIHVQDHCRAIDLVWRNGRVGEIYNVGGGCEHTNLELTHALLRVLGKSDSLLRFVADRPGHDRRYALDCSKIKHELNWHPIVPFHAGLHETVRWYQQNPEWLQLRNPKACRQSANAIALPQQEVCA
jgi:dTDP-glucose 4,6-dehydratase